MRNFVIRSLVFVFTMTISHRHRSSVNFGGRHFARKYRPMLFLVGGGVTPPSPRLYAYAISSKSEADILASPRGVARNLFFWGV